MEITGCDRHGRNESAEINWARWRESGGVVAVSELSDFVVSPADHFSIF